MANISIRMILKIPFLILSTTNIQYVEKKLTWKFYTSIEALPTIKQVKFISKKKFTKVVLDKNSESFIVYIAALKAPLKLLKMTIYLS